MNGDQDGTTADYAYNDASEALIRIEQLEQAVERLCRHLTRSAVNPGGHEMGSNRKSCILCGQIPKGRF